MPQYRRATLKGSTFFFTVVLADRSSALLVDDIERLPKSYRIVRERRRRRFLGTLELDQERLFPRLGRKAAIAKQNRPTGKGDLAASLLGARDPR